MNTFLGWLEHEAVTLFVKEASERIATVLVSHGVVPMASREDAVSKVKEILSDMAAIAAKTQADKATPPPTPAMSPKVAQQESER